LGLESLDDFIERRVQENCQKDARFDGFLIPDQLDQYRQIGASTWMSVRICQNLLIRRHVHVQIKHGADVIVDQILRFMTILGSPGVNQMTGSYVFENGGIMRVGSNPGRGIRNEIVFDDFAWKGRTIRRAEGPFAMIRTIQLLEGHYLGCDEDGTVWVRFPVDGAEEFLKEHSDVKGYGFVWDEINQRIIPPVLGTCL